ncbi:MAG: NAD-dependent epimerase/dehydratase family protein, partial [Ruminococcus sp.]|nr:NAD-dependent epimerase/dehydratase family protein [Ruminococcus sp.]
MDYKVKDCVLQSIYSDAYEIANAEIPWDKLVGSTVLITGGGGFIGGYLALALLTRNDVYGSDIRVISLVRNAERAEKKFGKLLRRGDFSLCVQDVNEEIKAERADYIIHAASQASNIQFENDPVGTITANLTGTANVLDFAKKSGAKSTLIVSSLKVYGIIYGSQDKITEDDSGYIDFTSYKNCYAMGKRASETIAASYCREYGMNVKLARPAYIYGAATLDDDRVWAQFIANVVRGQDILLKSNGAANRSFC